MDKANNCSSTSPTTAPTTWRATSCPWKCEQGTTADGKMLGLGTDVGSMAMCYRTDLFKKAGLPTDRDEVGALWPTWDALHRDRSDLQAQGDKDANFIDAATNIFNTILMQKAGSGAGYTYFDKTDNVIDRHQPGRQGRVRPRRSR